MKWVTKNWAACNQIGLTPHTDPAPQTSSDNDDVTIMFYEMIIILIISK